jgi:telomere length regulation protein
MQRLSPIKLNLLMRSSTYLSTISNRIAASQDRAKFIGMVVGEALSGLVHGEEKRLDFHMDETNTAEAKWYKSLVHVSDSIGPISPLSAQSSREEQKKPRKTQKAPKPVVRPSAVRPRSPPKPGFIIEEIDDDEDDKEKDDDLVAYAKPDSDAEDSDDDPTVINRNKPKAPVYIRDLIAYLRDTENYDRQKLALATAPTLIRRKANYGTEVAAHAEEVATLLVGLQDKYKLDDFDNLRIQGMMATIVAQPRKMGQWFAKTFFDGDYSLSQRVSILAVLGLSAREIAGFDTSEYAAAAAFPSKRLPARMDKYYALPPSFNAQDPYSNLKALPPNAVESISHSLSQTFLAPLVASAADAATGPDALKLSSFTSRLHQQTQLASSSSSPSPSASTSTSTSTTATTTTTTTRHKSKTPGVRAIPNTTASLIASSFFFPLTSRFQAALHSSAASTRGILFQPQLLALYVRTLALLLHAAGPSTLALAQMTRELWDLLLGLRTQCIGEAAVTGAVLFGLMTLLEVNEGDMRGLCERQGREVVESVEWVGGVFDRTRGGDGAGDEEQVKVMAAGVLVRLREAVEKYRLLLMGDLIGVA